MCFLACGVQDVSTDLSVFVDGQLLKIQRGGEDSAASLNLVPTLGLMEMVTVVLYVQHPSSLSWTEPIFPDKNTFF